MMFGVNLITDPNPHLGSLDRWAHEGKTPDVFQMDQPTQ